MQAYSYDQKGHYTGQYNCQLDPIATQKNGEAVYLLPASATFLPPPEYSPETEVPVWDGGKWTVEALPEPDPEPEPTPEPEPEPTEVERLRAQVADLQNQILTMRLGG